MPNPTNPTPLNYLAGINTALLAEAAEGFPVLISFADVLDRPGVWERELLPRLEAGKYSSAILDSGAFTVFTRGITVELEAFKAFAAEHGHLFGQIITLDDIAGDLTTTWNNTAELLSAGVDAVPVFHGGGVEPWEVLHHYCQKFDRVALGFARNGNTISKDQGNGMSPDAWLTEALNICESYGVAVHGLGMTRYALKRGHTRLTTVDSSTWVAEYRALRSRIGSLKCSDRLGDGDAALLLGPLTDDELLQLVAWSYRGTGADDYVRDVICADASGQAKTPLVRFNTEELERVLAHLDAKRVAAEAEAVALMAELFDAREQLADAA